MQVQENFSYSAPPHAAPMKSSGSRPKYRNDENDAAGSPTTQNIMYDSRVVRGNTYSPKLLTGGGTSGKNEFASTTSNQRSHPTPGMPSKLTRREFRRPVGGAKRSMTPPAVDGRVHMVMQTEEFLEELTDRPIEQDAETQTQAFMDRPASPLFIRSKIGFDIATQIEPGDLFDFDIEVQPILEVLVGKTLHVAMLEIMQEEELEAIRVQQEEYEMIRNIELAEVQRLEAEIKRKEQEKERRLQQEKKRLEDRHRLDEIIAARQFSNQFLGELHHQVFQVLEDEGHFYDPVQREIEELFMGPLVQGVTRGAQAYEAASLMAFELLEQASLRAKVFEAECIQKRQAYREQLAREEAEAERLRQEEDARLALEAKAKAEAEIEGGGAGREEE